MKHVMVKTDLRDVIVTYPEGSITDVLLQRYLDTRRDDDWDTLIDWIYPDVANELRFEIEGFEVLL